MKNNTWHKKIIANSKLVKDYIKKNVPSNEFCKSEKIYNLINFIIKEKQSNLYGSSLVLDGGQSL